MTPATATGRVRRGLLWAAIGIVGYLAFANALLNTALPERWINRQPERFTMHWSHGLTLWPGQVTLWNVEVGGHVRYLQWHIQAERASGRVGLWPLWHKELRVSGLAATAPRIHIRHVEDELPPRPPAEHGLRLDFRQVRVASPIVLDVDDWHMEGQADITTAWVQQLRGGSFSLSPSQITLTQARVTRHDTPWLDEGTLRGEVGIAPHRRQAHPGIRILDMLSAELQIQARTAGLRLTVDEALSLNTALDPNRGGITARLKLEQGALEPASRMELRLPLAAKTASGLDTAGNAFLTITAHDTPSIQAELSLPPIPGLLQQAEASLRLDGADLPLPPWKEQLVRLGGTVDLHSRFTSLALVQPLLERLSDLTLEGRGDVKGHIALAQGRLAPGTAVTASDAHFDLKAFSHRFHGQARASARYEDNHDGIAQAIGEVVLERFDLAPADAPDAVLGSGRELRLDFTSRGDLGELRDHIAARLRFGNARLPELVRFNRYLPSKGLRILSGSGTLDADVSMDVANARSGGRLALTAQGAGIRLGEMVMRADLALDARLDAGRLGDHRFALPGTRLKIAQASIVEPPGERVSGWWGQADITDGHVYFGQPMRLRANAQAHMRDIAPLLSLYSRNTRFPRWIRRLIDEGKAHVSGQVALEQDTVVLDGIQAHNERFETKARLRLDGSAPDGQLYARWGVLGMGLSIDKGERDFRFVNPREWFESQPPLLPAAH